MEDDLLVTDIAGEFGPEWLDGLNRELQYEVDKEKAGYYVRQSQIAYENRRYGVGKMEALGQEIARVDMATWMRWQLAEPGIWQDKASVRQFLKDNPECKSPGMWMGLR